MRTALDFSPLYRSTVGFDRLLNLLDSTSGAADATSVTWPPYNIKKLEADHYRITMAVAGFTPEEINLVQQENTLLVEARKHPEPEGVQVLHRGIANAGRQPAARASSSLQNQRSPLSVRITTRS